MDPLTAAAVSFGLNAVGTGLGFFGQQDEAARNNKAIAQRNRYCMRQHAYGEQIKDFEHRNALKIYAMRQEQAKLQVQEFQTAYKDYFFDEQMAMNQMIDQAKLSALQSDIKLQRAQSQTMSSSLARGVTGRRAGRGGISAMNAIMAGMEGVQRAKQLAMNEQMMDTRIGRAARKTDLRSKMAINAIGPRPERAPTAPLPFMESSDPGPSLTGLFGGLANAGASAMGTYGSLKAPKTGGIDYNQNFGTDVDFSMPSPSFNPSQQGFKLGG